MDGADPWQERSSLTYCLVLRSPSDTEANLGVMDAENVNIVVHGHDPSLSEMICEYADDPEMIAYAKEHGCEGHHRYPVSAVPPTR